MFTASAEIHLGAVLKMRIPRVEIGMMSRYSGAAILKFTVVNRIVVIVVRKQIDSDCTVCK
jgi:hypothetical protein